MQYVKLKKMLQHEEIRMYNHTQKHIRLAKGTYRYIAFKWLRIEMLINA